MPPLELLEPSACTWRSLLCSVQAPSCAGPGWWNTPAPPRGGVLERGGAAQKVQAGSVPAPPPPPPAPPHRLRPTGPAPAPAYGSTSPDTHVRLVLLPIEDPQQRRVLVSSEIQRDVVHSCDCREGAEGDR